MNAASGSPLQARFAVSPYARRLAGERDLDLVDLTGSGPGGRIVASDVLSYQPPITESPPGRALPTPSAQVMSFGHAVSLAAIYRLAVDAANVGLEITLEDFAPRAAIAALDAMDGDLTRGVAIEADGRQIMIGTASGLSIGAERRLRLDALDRGADVSAEPATASLLVLHAARVVPGALPVLRGRTLRFGLVVNREAEQGHAMLCATGDAMTEVDAIALLEAFVGALERPLALLA